MNQPWHKCRSVYAMDSNCACTRPCKRCKNKGGPKAGTSMKFLGQMMSNVTFMVFSWLYIYISFMYCPSTHTHRDTNAQNSCARTENTGHRHRNNQTNKQSNQCTNQQGNEPTDCKPAKFSQPTNEETFT